MRAQLGKKKISQKVTVSSSTGQAEMPLLISLVDFLMGKKDYA